MAPILVTRATSQLERSALKLSAPVNGTVRVMDIPGTREGHVRCLLGASLSYAKS